MMILAGCGNRQTEANERAACEGKDATPKESINACTKIISSKDPDTETLSYAYLYRGISYDHLGRAGEAKADFEQSLRMLPNNALAATNLGALHGKEGRFTVAMQYLDRAIQLDESNPFAWRNRAIALERLGNFPKALEDINRAVALDGADHLAVAERCWLNAVTNQKLDQALSDCNLALATQPESSNILNSRGLVYFRRKQFPESILDYDAAIRGDPSEPSSFLVRGYAKRAMGLDEEGAADIDKAAQLSSEVSSFYATIGVPDEVQSVPPGSR
ncbi:MAG: hypothetical protein A3E01_19330 [Gammaproteobacteria bacterium RIFCSPHIGHO2_12_FULL_63_22]|nr:MAG: hypothetical protein A3E01_19330 [Gammaproteobacteria bacterium RIFCSPHIGHO2_12_FULL_63_22]